MLPVVGTIIYRVQINDSSSEVAIRNAKKRKRQEPLPREVLAHNESVADFFLFSDRQSGSQLSEYLLLIPLCLSKMVAEAAENKLPVIVSDYSLVKSPNDTRTTSFPMLELSTNGLKLQQQFIPSLPDLDLCLSLCQFAKKELFEEKYTNPTLRTYHDIIATIDAVSPIIALDPSNPFALVELYDKQQQDFCCTLVLRGVHALTWHDALHPGDTWYFTSLTRQSWKVPNVLLSKEAFQHLNGRIPSFVLAFSSKTKLVFDTGSCKKGNLCIDLPPLSWTIRPLVSIQGQVVDVKEDQVMWNNVSHRISWIDISSEADDPGEAFPLRCCRVFIQHFPLSGSLHRGLKPGAIVRAVNIHRLNLQVENAVVGFGACLRTTISMIEGSVESSLKRNDSRKNDRDVMISHGAPLFFGNVSLSYQDGLAVKSATDWLKKSFPRREICIAPVPDIKDILRMASRNGTFPRKLKTRNPYAEFFDHGRSETQPMVNQPEVVGGCSMTQCEMENTVAPTFIVLKDMLAACEDIVVARFTSLLSTSNVKSSWVGSLHLSPNELYPLAESTTYVGGHVKHVDSFGYPTSIADYDCIIPLRCISMTPVPIESFFISELRSVVVSVFCLDAPIDNDTLNLQQPRVRAKPLPASDTSCGRLNTGLRMLCIDRYALLVSVQVRCGIPEVVSSGTMSGLSGPRTIPSADKPIHTCMDLFEEKMALVDHYRGILSRHRFRMAKASSDGLCKSLILTVASFECPDPNSDEVVPFLIPSFKVNVTVPISTAMVVTLKQFLNACSFAAPGIPEEQYVLGANWWKVAETPATSPLVCGGWDEHIEGASAQNVVVVVRLPGKAFELARRGFIRGNCSLGYLETYFQNARGIDRAWNCVSDHPFNFVGSRQFYDGMLDRRPPRRGRGNLIQSHTLGPMVSFDSPFTPVATISKLFSDACETIRKGKPSTSPSCVWRVSGADFLGISFCQARCMCGVCFEPLQRSTTDRKRNKKHRVPTTNSSTGGATSNYMLVCPNQCPSHAYEVVWECSGTLDDGTGQAKLHAEREAALTLLQINREAIEQVERGIWYLDDGTVQFNQTMPPPRELKARLDWAILQGYRQNTDPMTLLDERTKAEYVLHEHCRAICQRPQELDYLVRCKPMADHVVHLTHVMLETRVQSYRGDTTEKRDIPTYGLPTMRLQLVDCCIRM